MSLPLSAIPKPITSYSTTLASAITSSDTTIVVSSALDDAGNAISGVVGITIDMGTSVEEYCVGSKSGANITTCLRGIDPQDGVTERASLKQAHQRGATVTITDAPFLPIAYRLLNGDEGFPNKLKYASHPTLNADEQLADKKYVDDAVIAGAVDASTTTKGIVKLTTAPSSPTEPIAVGATDVATTGASKVVRSKADAKIDDSLVALTTAGDIVYSDGTDLQRLALGTSGYFLSAGATAPAWGGANLAEANTFFGATDLSGAEAETLSSGPGSNANALHGHGPLLVYRYTTATDSPTTVTATIPAGRLGINGGFRVTAYIYGVSSYGGGGVPNVLAAATFGGTAVLNATLICSGNSNGNAVFTCTVFNNASASAQYFGSHISNSFSTPADSESGLVGTATINTANNADFVLTLTNTPGGGTATGTVYNLVVETLLV